MNDIETVIREIQRAFGGNRYPGDNFLQGSFEGSEPYDEIQIFKGLDWKHIDPVLLDAHYTALHFFSEAGLRFFLPAFLVADLHCELRTADPLFTLVHGFSDTSVKHQTKSRTFVRRIGRSAFINPRRYGGITFYDYARYRLSVFTREEAKAIVAYLYYKRETSIGKLEVESIDAALDLYWLERMEHAPTSENLEQHVKDEQEYLGAIRQEAEDENR